MKPNREPLALTPHWHVDCRIEADLPEDNVVGTRFLINVLFGAVTVAAIISTGWLAYLSLSLRYQIRDWEQRIGDNRAEVRDIQRMKIEYAAEALKVDQAYALVRPRFNVSGFVANLGRTRPEPMTIDNLDWSENVIIMRGGLRETTEAGTQLLGNYVKQLERDEKISPLVREVRLTNFDPGPTRDLIKFEITFRLKPPKP